MVGRRVGVGWMAASVVGRPSAGSRFPRAAASCAAAAGDARLHGADGDVEGLGDLGVVEVGDVAEHDGDAELLGQPGQGGVDRHPVDDAVDRAARQRVGRLGGPVARRRRRAGPGAACAGGARRGRRWWRCGRPTWRTRPAVEAVEPADDADHRLLGGVVGVAAGAGDPPAHGVDAVVVPPQQGVERAGGRRPARRRPGRRRSSGPAAISRSVISPIEPRYGLPAAPGVPAELAQHDQHVACRDGRRRRDRCGDVGPSWSASAGPQSVEAGGICVGVGAEHLHLVRRGCRRRTRASPVPAATSVTTSPTPACRR